MTRSSRLVVAGAFWLALFAALFTIGSAFGLWPQPPEGAFRGVDLFSGLAFGLLLLVFLLRRPRS